MPDDQKLMADLEAALIANGTTKTCEACEALAGVEHPSVRAALASALGGTIGSNKLVTILRSNGYSVGRRAIDRHRQEGHTQ